MVTSDRQMAQFESLQQSGLQVTIWMHRRVVFLWWWFSPPTRKSVYSPPSRKTCGHFGKLGHFAQVCKIKSGASRNLLKSRTPRQTTNSEGTRYKSRVPVNTVDAPDSSVQTSVSFSDSDDNEFVFTVEGTTTTSITQETANCQDRNSRCSSTHFGGFWGIGEHAGPCCVWSYSEKGTDSLGTDQDPHTCFWRSKTAAFAREISSGNRVGEQSHSRYVLGYRSTNWFFIQVARTGPRDFVTWRFPSSFLWGR